MMSTVTKYEPVKKADAINTQVSVANKAIWIQTMIVT